MTILIASLALIELSIFFVYDLVLSKGNRSERYFIRLMSCVGGIALILSEFALPCHTGMQELAVDISMSAAILALSRSLRFRSTPPLVCSCSVWSCSYASVSDPPASLISSVSARCPPSFRCSSLSCATIFTSLTDGSPEYV